MVERRSSATDMEVIHTHTQIRVKATSLICFLSQQSGKRGVKAEAGANTSQGPPLPPRQQQVVPAGAGRSTTLGLPSPPKRSRQGAKPTGSSFCCVFIPT